MNSALVMELLGLKVSSGKPLIKPLLTQVFNWVWAQCPDISVICFPEFTSPVPEASAETGKPADKPTIMHTHNA